MHQTQTPMSTPPPGASTSGVHFRRPGTDTSPPTAESIGELPTSDDFAALRAAYRATGGIARGDDVARLLEDHGLATFVGLARLLASSDVFGFEWRSTLWIPMFQFELRDLSVKPATLLVLAELGRGWNGWARAVWFARPNIWLQDRPPVDLVDTQLAQVLRAARAERFIDNG